MAGPQRKTNFNRMGVTMVVATTIKITGPRKLLPISPRAMPLLATIRATSPREIMPTPMRAAW